MCRLSTMFSVNVVLQAPRLRSTNACVELQGTKSQLLTCSQVVMLITPVSVRRKFIGE